MARVKQFLRLTALFACAGFYPVGTGWAAEHTAQCTQHPAPALPPTLAPWTSPTPVSAAPQPDGLNVALLTVGKAAQVTLHPTTDIQYSVRPEAPGGKVSSGRLLAFDTPDAGTYRVMLSGRAWLDVITQGKVTDSTHHQHGPACSGIGKMVDFTLPAGRQTIQISGSGTPALEVMVIKVQ
ncbi:MAG: hypothetical protein ACTINM_09050 [Acetobacter cibinongensis]